VTNTNSGTIISVNISSNGGVPKYPQQEVFIDRHGITGDYHSGEINKHKKSGPSEPNSRPISIVSLEVLNEINAALGINLQPGDLAENITTNNLGNLAELEEGDTINIGAEVILRVTGQNKPCAVLNVYHDLVSKSLVNKRGITATVINTGTIKPNDTCYVIKGNL
tara:strand:+ start:8641 stop:9138 length:498 start_codon:yes stop_codon:yes gene_type:complete